MHPFMKIANEEAATAEQLASGHWNVLHLPINTRGVEVERS